jgi:hypothetical protein
MFLSFELRFSPAIEAGKNIADYFIGPLNASSLNEPDQNNHYGHDQEDVNESSDGVGGDYPQQPKQNKNHGDCFQHNDFPG